MALWPLWLLWKGLVTVEFYGSDDSVWSDSSCTNPIRFLDLENVGIAVGISSRFHLKPDI